MGNLFFGMSFLGRNAPKISNSNYTALYQKIAFKFDSGPREVPKPDYTQIRALAYFMCFLVWALPKVRDQNRIHFFDKVLNNSCCKFFCFVRVSRFKKWRSKKRIFHCIFKTWIGWEGTYFVTKKILKKPNTPVYAQVLVVTCQKHNSVAALLSLPP